MDLRIFEKGDRVRTVVSRGYNASTTYVGTVHSTGEKGRVWFREDSSGNMLNAEAEQVERLCRHDDAVCHHYCLTSAACFREKHGMILSQPKFEIGDFIRAAQYEGFEKTFYGRILEFDRNGTRAWIEAPNYDKYLVTLEGAEIQEDPPTASYKVGDRVSAKRPGYPQVYEGTIHALLPGRRAWLNTGDGLTVIDLKTVNRLDAAPAAGRVSMRRLHLERDEDVSGVSGTGVVAYGVLFPDGSVVLRWDTVVRSTVMYDSLSDAEKIVGHGGLTRIVFDDA